MLCNYDLLPKSLELEKRIYSFNKHLKKSKFELSYLLDADAFEFFVEHYKAHVLEYIEDKNCYAIKQKIWDATYKKAMDPVRDYLKKTPTLLNDLNNILFNEVCEKYLEGTISKWEMETVGFYYHEHELANINNKTYDFADFSMLSEEPIVNEKLTFKGKTYIRYKLNNIIGTVLDKDKIRHTVSILTLDGVVTLKLYRTQFTKFDKQISVKDETGKKRVVEKSWFTRGNILFVQGLRRGEYFIPKSYKNSEFEHPIKLVNLLGNDIELIHDRASGIEEDGEDD